MEIIFFIGIICGLCYLMYLSDKDMHDKFKF